MSTLHQYHLTTRWIGNLGTGTSGLADYKRIHTISIEGKPTLTLTTDDAVHGDKTILNPEDLLVMSLSSCHMMSYLYLCAKAHVVITSYVDEAIGTMEESEKEGGRFTEVILRPICEVQQESMKEMAMKLHHQANKICFIAASVNFQIMHEPVIIVSSNPT